MIQFDEHGLKPPIRCTSKDHFMTWWICLTIFEFFWSRERLRVLVSNIRSDAVSFLLVFNQLVSNEMKPLKIYWYDMYLYIVYYIRSMDDFSAYFCFGLVECGIPGSVANTTVWHALSTAQVQNLGIVDWVTLPFDLIGIFGKAHSYCWWLKSCTTWDVWNPINNGIFTISTG